MNSVINQDGTIPAGYVVPIFTITLFIFSLPVYAGMPSPEIIITTVASFPTTRVSTISFFIFIILMAALFTKLLWNYLRQDFSSLPFITYKKSLAFVLLLGLLLNVVLFMIAGARELMTPGAWELAEPNQNSSISSHYREIY